MVGHVGYHLKGFVCKSASNSVSNLLGELRQQECVYLG
jgi:hypothetical protein